MLEIFGRLGHMLLITELGWVLTMDSWSAVSLSLATPGTVRTLDMTISAPVGVGVVC